MKISVVIIAKNAEKTIAKCLTSITEQTHPPHEIIVVNGHSTDRTREIASRFPVKLVSSPQRHTYGLSRNIGVKASTGDIVAFLDTDDFANQKWLETVQKTFIDGKIGVMNSKRIFAYTNNWFTDLKWNRMGKKGQLLDKSTSREPWREFGTSGSAFRKELIQKAGYFDEDMFFNTEDKELAIRIFNLGYEIKSVPDSVIHFRPASSAIEWLKEGYYRHGMGHGTIRRRHGKFHPPLLTPAATIITVLCLLSFFLLGFWLLIPLLLLACIFGALIKTYRYSRKTTKPIHCLVYVILEALERNLEFLGFVIGYAFPAKILRRIARH